MQDIRIMSLKARKCSCLSGQGGDNEEKSLCILKHTTHM